MKQIIALILLQIAAILCSYEMVYPQFKLTFFIILGCLVGINIIDYKLKQGIFK